MVSRILLNIAMFVLLSRYAPALASRYLPRRQVRIVDWLRSARTRSALLMICSVHPTKVVVAACALARVRFLFFVVSVILGNALVVWLYLSIGRHYSAELHVVIDWIWARRWWITLALVPLIAVVIVFAVRRAPAVTSVAHRAPGLQWVTPALTSAAGFGLSHGQLLQRVRSQVVLEMAAWQTAGEADNWRVAKCVATEGCPFQSAARRSIGRPTGVDMTPLPAPYVRACRSVGLAVDSHSASSSGWLRMAQHARHTAGDPR